MGFGEPEIKIITETWEVVKTLPAETVGGLLFKHIFEQGANTARRPQATHGKWRGVEWSDRERGARDDAIRAETRARQTNP